MDQSPNKTTALAFLDAHAQADDHTMSSLLAPDARFHTLKSATVWAGMPPVITGDETIAKMLSSRHGANGEAAVWKAGETTWEHHFIVEEGGYVVVYTTRRSTTLQDVKYENPYVCLFKFEDSRIVDLWEVLDTAYAQSVVSLPKETSAAWRGEG